MDRDLLILIAGLAGLLGGAAMCGIMALGIVLMLESAGAVGFALFRHEVSAKAELSAVPTLSDVLERARGAA